MKLHLYDCIKRSGHRLLFRLLAAQMMLLLVPAVVIAQSPARVDLGCAENYAVLAGSSITSTGYTIIDGELGLLPGSSVVGFPPAIVVNGSMHINDAVATLGKVCLNSAYDDAAGRTPVPTGAFLNPGAGNIGGLTLVPGLYKFSSSATLSGGDVTLTGGANDVWIFQIGSTLEVGATVQVVLSGDAQAKNVFWQVGTSATLGASSVVKGTIMADQSITLLSGARVDGRVLARIGAVTLDWSTVTRPPLASMSPTVILTDPSSSSIGIVLNQNVTADFSEAMDPSTISDMTFTLRQGSTPVAGTVSYSGVTATFNPAADLLSNTVYTATITTGARSMTGIHLNEDHVWNFTTAITPDVTPPTVSYTVPSFGAVNVPVNQRISATFSEEMNSSSISTSSFLLYAGAVPVAGTVDLAGITATFTPAANLAINTMYTATITTGARDFSGNQLVNSYSWVFTTGQSGDASPPAVSSTVPANLAQSVPINQILSVSFSEALNASTLNASTFLLRHGTDAVAGSVTYSGVTATFTPALPLHHLTTYSATITSGVRDLAGNPLTTNYTWYFTTSAIRDTIAPVVSYTIPAPSSVDVHENSSVSATFSEAMDPLTINTLSFVLRTGSVPVSGTVTYIGVTARFTPNVKLLYNTRYDATITTMAKDLAGNALAASYTWSFTTGSKTDVIGPAVISTMPANATLNVPVNQKVTAMFSEAIDPMTLTTSSFTLLAGTTPVPGSVTYVGVTAVFTPNRDLEFSTVYTARISASVMDLAGNAMGGDFVWHFATSSEVDESAPFVRYTVPIYNATGVPVNQRIAAIFSEQMDPQTISAATFTVRNGSASVTGMVTYTGRTATFSPAIDLAFYTTYDAALRSGAMDLAGNAILTDYTWSFKTGGLLPGPPVLDLGCAANFALLAGSMITSTGSTIVHGDLGVSPGTTLTGFPPGQVLNGSTHNNDALAVSAKLCLTAAYNDAANRTLNVILLSDGELGGRTLPPGLYRSAPGYFGISNSDLVLDAQGDPNAVWIFQMPSSMLVVGNGRKVLLGSGAQARNIFWQVGSSATLGTDAVMSGTIMANNSITLLNGAVLNGRAFAGNASITLTSNIINRPDIMVSVGTEKAPSGFTLAQNYPNPFNPATQITYGIAKAGRVSLRIFNVFGVEVATLVNAYQETGSYSVSFNSNDTQHSLSSGVYLYRLSVGDFVLLDRMMILQK